MTVLELAGRTQAPIAADLGAGLDARAKREYRRRLLELQAEIDDAEEAKRPGRAANGRTSRWTPCCGS